MYTHMFKIYFKEVVNCASIFPKLKEPSPER